MLLKADVHIHLASIIFKFPRFQVSFFYAKTCLYTTIVDNVGINPATSVIDSHLKKSMYTTPPSIREPKIDPSTEPTMHPSLQEYDAESGCLFEQLFKGTSNTTNIPPLPSQYVMLLQPALGLKLGELNTPCMWKKSVGWYSHKCHNNAADSLYLGDILLDYPACESGHIWAVCFPGTIQFVKVVRPVLCLLQEPASPILSCYCIFAEKQKSLSLSLSHLQCMYKVTGMSIPPLSIVFHGFHVNSKGHEEKGTLGYWHNQSLAFYTGPFSLDHHARSK